MAEITSPIALDSTLQRVATALENANSGSGSAVVDYSAVKAQLDKVDDSVAAAQTSATNAATSETNAKTSETNASTYYNNMLSFKTVGTLTTATLSAANWADSKYSFEADYPVAEKSISELQPYGTKDQVSAFTSAMIVGSPAENVLTALGTVPTVDIPVMFYVVSK